jgi:hypothetical protein
MRGWPAAIARATVTRDSTTTAARPTARLADRRRPTPQPMRPPSQAASSSTGQCPGRRHPAATSSPIQTVDSCAPSARRRAIWCWSAPVRVSTDARSPVRCTGPRGVRCSVRLSAARAGVPGQVAAVSWTRRRLAQPHLTTSIGGVSGYRDAHISSDRVRAAPVHSRRWVHGQHPSREGPDAGGVTCRRGLERLPGVTTARGFLPIVAAMDANIEVRGIHKRYRPTTDVDDLSFTVRAGQVTGFVGPNGRASPRRCASSWASTHPTRERRSSVAVGTRPYGHLFSTSARCWMPPRSTRVDGHGTTCSGWPSPTASPVDGSTRCSSSWG